MFDNEKLGIILKSNKDEYVLYHNLAMFGIDYEQL
jgi:hypothetical protein